MRYAGLLLLATIVACKPGSSGNSNTDAGSMMMTQNQQFIEISGTVVYDPAELAWRGLPPDFASTGPCTNGGPAAGGGSDGGPAGAVAFWGNGASLGAPPCLQGDTFNIEDAIKALEMLPPLNSVPLTWNGSFDVKNVNVTDTQVGIVGDVNDPSFNVMAAMPTGLSFSGYGLGKPPFNDGSDPATAMGPIDTKNLPVYVLSVDFLSKIAKAIGSNFSSMVGTGMVLVHVVDSDSLTPIAGATMQHVYPNSTGTGTTFSVVEDGMSDTDMSFIYYLNDDLTGLAPGQATSSSGLIVRLAAGSAATYTVTTSDSTQVYEQALNGSRAGTALELFIRKCPVNANVAGLNECPTAGG